MQLMFAPNLMLANASAASSVMRSYITPVMTTLIAIASIAVVFFLVNGGIHYMTSSGNPERLEHAKKVIRNALIGLVMVIAAGTLTAILSTAYIGGGPTAADKLPSLVAITPAASSNGLVDALTGAITGLLQNIIQSAAKPFLDGLAFFTTATPLMAGNSSVFNLWLAIVGIADGLFVLVVALLGFHVMSFATFGLEEIEFKHLLPRIGLVFLLVNSSIFLIDGVIGVSNGMISALNAAFPAKSVWQALSGVVTHSGTLGLAALLMMVAFLILAVMLMIYYVLRLVTLYIGAVLSPILFLLWLLPDFKDFVETAAKTYIGTIFVLFIHVVILELAASIFAGMIISSPDQTLNPIMSMVVGVATILALLKTQSVLSQMSYMSLGPRTAAKLGGQLSNVVSHYGSKSFQAIRSGGSGDGQGGSGGSSGRNTRNQSYADTTREAPRANATPRNYASAARPMPSGGGRSSKTRVAPSTKTGVAQ